MLYLYSPSLSVRQLTCNSPAWPHGGADTLLVPLKPHSPLTSHCSQQIQLTFPQVKPVTCDSLTSSLLCRRNSYIFSVCTKIPLICIPSARLCQRGVCEQNEISEWSQEAVTLVTSGIFPMNILTGNLRPNDNPSINRWHLLNVWLSG